MTNEGGLGEISIHALRVEGDRAAEIVSLSAALISIHALRVEGDILILADESKRLTIFLSTPSGWRATHSTRRIVPGQAISIHALRVEGDNVRKVL